MIIAGMWLVAGMDNYINGGLLQVVAGIICMLNLYQFHNSVVV